MSESFYHSTLLSTAPGEIAATIFIHRDHALFDGHFPGQPILPGVCMIQLIRETLERSLNKTVQLKQADTVKFLQVIDPNKISDVDLKMKYTPSDAIIKVDAKLVSGDVIYFKFTGTFELS